MRITTAREAAVRLRVGMPAGDVFRPGRRAVSIPDINAASAPVVVGHARLREAHAGLPVERLARQKKGRNLRSH